MTMKCKDCLRLIDDFRAGSVPDNLKEQLTLHLDSCPECSDEFNRAQRLAELLAQRANLTPPPEYFDQFLPRLQSRLESLSPPSRVRSKTIFFPRPAWGLALGTAAAVLAFVVFRGPDPVVSGNQGISAKAPRGVSAAEISAKKSGVLGSEAYVLAHAASGVGDVVYW